MVKGTIYSAIFLTTLSTFPNKGNTRCPFVAEVRAAIDKERKIDSHFKARFDTTISNFETMLITFPLYTPPSTWKASFETVPPNTVHSYADLYNNPHVNFYVDGNPNECIFHMQVFTIGEAHVRLKPL